MGRAGRGDQRRAGPRSARLGLTLIEITLTLAIAAAVTATAVASVNALSDASLRSAAVELSGALKLTYDRAVMQRRTQRLAIDLDQGTISIDYTEDPFALSRERLGGDHGETAAEAGEGSEDGKRKKSLFDDDVDPAVHKALEGGKGTQFIPDADIDLGKPTRLAPGVRVTKMWTGHQEEAFTSGVAYVHFFSGGWTEPAIIELADDQDDVITLKVLPLTGRVRTYDHALDIPKPVAEDGREEGDE